MANLNVRMSDDEKAVLQAKADAVEVDLSTWAKYKLGLVKITPHELSNRMKIPVIEARRRLA